MSQGIRLKWGVRTMLSLVLLEALVSTHICYLKKEIRKCGADSSIRLLLLTASAIVLVMFENFSATDRWTKKQVHCVYQAQIVAIATRHADAVDYKFLVDGRKVWVALPHPAWVEYHKRTGTMITDSLGVEIAGHYLKSALEAGEGLGREMYSLTVEETLKHLDAAVAEMQAQPA
jgi:hypothetical protein